MPSSMDEAIAACTALYSAYCTHADAGAADALANLYTPTGVFDRLGQLVEGRDAIRQFIASRRLEGWTRHHCSNVRIEIAADGRSATGKADLRMERGRHDSETIEQIQAEYRDHFLLTGEGWRFSRRVVVLR